MIPLLWSRSVVDGLQLQLCPLLMVSSRLGSSASPAHKSCLKCRCRVARYSMALLLKALLFSSAVHSVLQAPQTSVPNPSSWGSTKYPHVHGSLIQLSWVKVTASVGSVRVLRIDFVEFYEIKLYGDESNTHNQR